MWVFAWRRCLWKTMWQAAGQQMAVYLCNYVTCRSERCRMANTDIRREKCPWQSRVSDKPTNTPVWKICAWAKNKQTKKTTRIIKKLLMPQWTFNTLNTRASKQPSWAVACLVCVGWKYFSYCKLFFFVFFALWCLKGEWRKKRNAHFW